MGKSTFSFSCQSETVIHYAQFIDQSQEMFYDALQFHMSGARLLSCVKKLYFIWIKAGSFDTCIFLWSVD